MEQRTPASYEIFKSDRFGSGLVKLLNRAFKLLDLSPYKARLDPGMGMLKVLSEMKEGSEDASIKGDIESTLSQFKSYFRISDADRPETNDGVMDVEVSDDSLNIYLTLTPPRGQGNMPTVNAVQNILAGGHMIFGIDDSAIHRALETVRNDVDIVWRTLIATGQPCEPPPIRDINFEVPAIQKQKLLKDSSLLGSGVAETWQSVSKGDAVGSLELPAAGVPGKDVFGRKIAAPDQDAISVSDALSFSGDKAYAQTSGYVVTNGARVDIVPMYVLDNPEAGELEDFSFSGAVLVKGNLMGPCNIECEDAFITGNCEQANLHARGDIVVGGGIVGHNKSEIYSDGAIAASFISETEVSALGEVNAADAILNSRLSSGDSIRVRSGKGMIAGGTINALKDVVSASIGSEFGMITEILVGKDYLTPARLISLVKTIKTHEENLKRIETLKQEIARSKVSIENLPQDKQELYIGILRKEDAYQRELESLFRRKELLDKRLTEFLEASVQVAGSLFPPSKIQILDAIMEIKDELNAVTLRYSDSHVVIQEVPEDG